MTKDVIKLKNRRGGAGSILSGRALNVVTHIHIREREREREGDFGDRHKVEKAK